MFPNTTKQSISSRDTVNLTSKQTFYCEGVLFRIFKSKSTSPKAPPLAIVRLDTKERVSGLFRVGENTYQGDIKTTSGKKYFRITIQDENTIILEGFKEALIQSVLDTSDSTNRGFVEAYRGFERLLESEPDTAVKNRAYSDISLCATGVDNQLKLTSELT